MAAKDAALKPAVATALHASKHADEVPWIAADDLVTVVAPVWGRGHVDRFLDVVLPSWLAPGNIPALAEGRAGVRLLTRLEDMPRLGRSAALDRLREIAHVELAAIDDLLAPGADFVPVTLTLALQRGIAAGVVPGMPRRFLLLNGDFALADGALRGALAQWTPGAKLLLAPSLRVVEETIRSRLRDLVDETGALALPPREMVGLALDHLHPTVLASRMDQRLLRSTNPHQLYWRFDRGTLIARAFCMFVLGVELDAPPAPAAAYCDYGMGALMTGGAPPVMLGCSDDFFALELAPNAYEARFVEYGPPDVAFVAERLENWTTAFHRRQARAPIVCLSGPPGPELARAQAEADGVIADILARLSPPHLIREHPNWRGGVAGWRRRRAEVGLLKDPAELELPISVRAANDASPPSTFRGLVRALIVGGPNARLPWHPFWRLHKAILDILDDARAKEQAVQVLGATRLMTFDPLASGRLQAEKGAGGVLIAALDASHKATLAAQLAAAKRAAADAARVVLVVFRQDGEPLPALDTARLWRSVDGWLTIEHADTLALGIDAAAERAYGAMADHASWRAPLSSLRTIAAAAVFPLAVAAANARGASAKGDTTALIVQGRRRADSPP